MTRQTPSLPILALSTIGTLLCFLACAGCAEIASGPRGIYLDASGKPVAPAARVETLQVSAGEIASMSSRYLGEIEFTFENPSAQWIRVEKVQLDFGGDRINHAISIPWGSQLESWAEATHQRNAIRNANQRTALEAIAVGGALVSAAGGRSAGGLALAGGVASLGAATASYFADVQTRVEAAERTPTFGRNHIFGGPFDVPPGLFVKRWLVVNTPADPGLGCISAVTMTFELADKTSHRVALALRASSQGGVASEWQREICGREFRLGD